MKKVGIITICDYQNYGNRLQNYAVQEILKDLGYEVTTIVNNSPKPDKIDSLPYKERIKRLISQNPSKIFDKILLKIGDKLNAKKKSLLLNQKISSFKNFTSKYISETTFTVDHRNIPTELESLFEYYIIGSDQIWNPSFRYGSGFDFGTFCNKKKKIALSPSFGVSDIPDRYKKSYSIMLNEIEHLSAREESGSNIIRELTGRDAPVLVDPTLILTKERWLKISSQNKYKPHKEYILTYFIGEKENEIKKWINSLAYNKGMEICHMANIKDQKRYAADPSEFIDYINSAQVLCTDSFHGVIFSILMGIPFIIFDRKGKSVKMSSRIDTLLSKFHLEDRRFNKVKTHGNIFNVNYSHIQDILDIERKKTMTYLNEALNGK